jgi:predicted TIM-barrel fold metal-dependent hydrolase
VHRIDRPQVLSYLRLAQEVAKSHVLVDAHAHASEVVFGSAAAQIVEMPYASSKHSPVDANVNAIRELDSGDLCCVSPAVRNRSSEAVFAAAYRHAGVMSFARQMEISHVSRVLLLPVAPMTGDVADQMQLLKNFRAADPRFHIGYSVPGNVPLDRITINITEAIRCFEINAIKIHPNLSRINSVSRSGVERIHAILHASKQLRLPVIIHGGRSPILEQTDASQFATLESMELIDWATTTSTVVMAHCGVYGYSHAEALSGVIPRLQKLLSRYRNLSIDTSGVPSGLLTDIFRLVDHERIIFGSDALYSPIWRAMAITLHAISMAKAPAQKTLAKIASFNPAVQLGLS